MNPDGSHIRQITHAPEGWSDDSPAWSPDGTKVAFYRGCRPSHCYGSRIMVVDVNTGDTRNAQVAGGPRRARWLLTLERTTSPYSTVTVSGVASEQRGAETGRTYTLLDTS